MSERILVTGGSGFIGSHLMEAIAARGLPAVNLDVKPPEVPEQRNRWRDCDVKDARAVTAAFDEFRPTRVIHLAAKANLNGKTVNDFADNIAGTKNVVDAANQADGVALVVNTSTQYVVRPGVCPDSDSYFEPYTAYGQSKAVAEQIVRGSCRKPWSIIRPTNIWGPRHPFFPHELWRYLERGYYVHPGLRPTPKYYGYVTNAVAQILRIALDDPVDEVAWKVWYIADGAIDNAEWMNGFSLGLRGAPVRRAPLPIWRLLAWTGDVMRAIGLRFPVNSDRLFRLTVPERIPDTKIVRLPDTALISLEEGIARCVGWYRSNKEAYAGKEK